MNMFKAVKATSYKEYFDLLPPDRREIFDALEKIIKETAPSLKPNFLYNMPGYGTFKYKNSKKEVNDWPTIGIASQKNYVSLYVCAVNEKGYIAEQYKDELGKATVGKSCISFKNLEDLNLDTLKKIIKITEQKPGFEK